MNSAVVVMGCPTLQYLVQMPLTEWDDKAQTLQPYTALRFFSAKRQHGALFEVRLIPNDRVRHGLFVSEFQIDAVNTLSLGRGSAQDCAVPLQHPQGNVARDSVLRAVTAALESGGGSAPVFVLNFDLFCGKLTK